MPAQCEERQGQMTVWTGANLIWVSSIGPRATAASVKQGGRLIGAAQRRSGPVRGDITLGLPLFLRWLILFMIKPGC